MMFKLKQTNIFTIFQVATDLHYSKIIINYILGISLIYSK